MALTQVQSGMMDSIAQYNSFKNRLINGAMVLDQRNNGAATTPTSNPQSLYTLDRWRLDRFGAANFTIQQVADAPVGFNRSLRATVQTTQASPAADDRYNIMQITELVNSADLSGEPMALSFWVKGSVTGTYSVFLSNAIGDPYRREYLSSYTINVANTWELKSLSIPANAWNTGQQTYPNGYGILVAFAIGCGTNRQYAGNTWYSGGGEHNAVSNQVQLAATAGATFQVTGVQLEKGSTATAFDYRPYGTELSLCQRYFQLGDFSNILVAGQPGIGASTQSYAGYSKLPVVMRATPSSTSTAGGNNSNLNWVEGGSSRVATCFPSTGSVIIGAQNGSAAASGVCYVLAINTGAGFNAPFYLSAEL